MGYGLTLADPAKRNTVIDLGIPGCGLLTPNSTGCSTQTLSWVHSEANDHPDVTMLMEGTFDAGAAQQAGGPGAACTPPYEAQYNRALDSAIATLHANDLPVFLTTNRDSEIGDVQSSDCINQMISAAAKRDSARLFDMHDLLCPAEGCVTDHAGQPVYDDTGHLGVAGQQWIGSMLLSAFQATVKPVAANAQPAATGICQTNASQVKPVSVPSYAATPLDSYMDSPTHSKLIDGVRGKPTFADPAWMGFQTTSTNIVEKLAAPAPVCSAASTWLQNLGGAVAVSTCTSPMSSVNSARNSARSSTISRTKRPDVHPDRDRNPGDHRPIRHASHQLDRRLGHDRRGLDRGHDDALTALRLPQRVLFRGRGGFRTTTWLRIPPGFREESVARMGIFSCWYEFAPESGTTPRQR